MESDEIQSIPKRKKVMSLVEIATVKCIQNVAKLQEVGNTPFHLIKPILKRMNVKQLKQIEEQNPHLVPDTDILWVTLIEKEFPDRPINIKSISLGSRQSMPYRALYFRYEKERESFRNDSTARLRNMTEKLKKQKSANSIISVPQLLKDPTVKRRIYNGSGGSGFSRQSQGPNKNSILSKARRELQSRNLMFPDYKSRTKAYDPFAIFKSNRPINANNNNNNNSISKPMRSIAIRPHKTNTTATRSSGNTKLNTNSTIISNTTKSPAFAEQSPNNNNNNNNNKMTAITTIPERKKEANVSNVSPPADRPSEITSVQPRPPVIKRKQEPSIFLTKVKRPRVVKPPQKREKQPLKEQSTPSRRITAVKSSIFS